MRCPKRGVVVGEQARWVGWVTVNDSKNADANSTANPISRVGVGEQARWVGWAVVNKRGGGSGAHLTSYAFDQETPSLVN